MRHSESQSSICEIPIVSKQKISSVLQLQFSETGTFSLEFFLNGEEHSLNSAISGNPINH